eukprot:8184023-Lingulodinium_polyedra.AAC.1
MECVNRETRCAAATECIPERISEQFSRESCSESVQKRIPLLQRFAKCARCARPANANNWCSH